MHITQSGFIKFTKRTLASYLILSTIIIGGGLIYLFGPWAQQGAEAAWFNDNWGYREEVPITANTGADTNTYISFSLDTATLITAGKLQSSCQDIRVTDGSGNILAYHVGRTNACNNAATTIDALVPTLAAGASTFYVYYGNPVASSKDAGAFSQSEASTYTVGTLGSEAKGTAPVGYWKFDDGNGTSTQDSTAGNKDGTLNLSGGSPLPSWQTEDQCISTKCLYFKGPGSEVTTSFDMNAATIPAMTVSVWVRRTGVSGSAAGFDEIISNDNGGYDRALTVKESDGTFHIFAGQDISTGIASDSGKWNFISVYWGSDAVLLYKNGVLVYSTGAETTTTGGNLTIGDSVNGSQGFNGFIDEVKVYNYKLTANQVKANYTVAGNPDGVSSVLGVSNQNLGGALSNGLIGYWKEDEASNADATDSSGNGSTLTDTNTVARAMGKFANGADFESGNSEYQYAADNAALSLTGSVTATGWIKPESVTAATSFDIAGKWDGANESYLLSQFGDEIRFYVDSSSNYQETTAANLATGTFYHIAAVYNTATATVKIYVNGAESASTTTGTIPSSIGDDAGRFQIGAEDSTTTAANFYDGVVDEVRVYNRTLSNSEVSQLYNFAPGPVAYWNMEETSWNGTTNEVKDTASGVYHGTADQGGTTGQGKIGRAGVFDGVNDRVLIVDTPEIDPLNITITAWAKADASTKGYILTKAFDGGSVPFSLNVGGNASAADLNGMAFFSSNAWKNSGITTDIRGDGKWHYIAGTYDGTTLKYYVDGVLDASSTEASGNLPTSLSRINIATYAQDSHYFGGSIDEVKIYNYARTQGQIVEDMNAGHPAPGSPVGSAVAYWKFDEGYSTTANDSNSTNGSENLTLSAASWTDSGKFGKAWNGQGTRYLSIADDDDLDFAAADDGTFSGWLKTDSASNPGSTEYILSKGPTSLAGYAVYFNTSGQLCFGVDDDTTWGPDDSACSTTDYYDATWHYFAGVKTGTSRIDLYVDGTGIASDTSIAATGSLANNTTFYVGDLDGTDNGSEFNGDLDEMKVFRSALTADQVKLDMNRGSNQVLGALSDNSTYQTQAANQEYCIPGDSTSCAAPTARYDLDEGTGTATNDSSGNGRTGTLTLMSSPGTSTSGWTSGKVSKGLAFDGSDDYVATGSNISNFITASDGTIEAWIYPTGSALTGAVAYALPAAVADGGGVGGYMGIHRGIIGGLDRIWFYNFDTTEDRVGGTYTANQWTHVVWVHTGGTLYGYVNGVLVGSTASGNTGDLTNPFQIGQDYTGNSQRFFTGKIDQVRVFNYGRTAAQIAWDYNKGGAVGWWKMDECQGTSLNDSSGNSLAGTYTGTTAIGTCTTASSAWLNGVTGKRNYSLDFAGSDEVVTVTNTSLIDIDNNLANFTFSSWFKAGTAGENNVGQIFNKTANNYLRVDNPSGSNLDIEANLDRATTDANINVSTATTTGTWTHVALTWDGTTLTLYINGLSRGTATGSGAVTADTGDLLIGGATAANFDGQIDDVRLYNYALTAPQAKNLYSNGAVGFQPTTGAP